MGRINDAWRNYQRAIELVQQSLRMRPDHENAERTLVSLQMRMSDVAYLREGVDVAEGILNNAKSNLSKLDFVDEGTRICHRL